MDITSAKYIQSELDSSASSIKAVIGGTTVFVPLDSNNTDYQAILEWAKEDGNEIQAAE